MTLREARLVLSGIARKEPHYRVYFRPSLGITLGRTLLLPDCDAPAWLNNPRAICEYTRNIGFVKPSSKIISGPAVNFGGLLETNKTAGFGGVRLGGKGLGSFATWTVFSGRISRRQSTGSSRLSDMRLGVPSKIPRFYLLPEQFQSCFCRAVA